MQNDLLNRSNSLFPLDMDPKGHPYCFNIKKYYCKLHFQSAKLITGSLNLKPHCKCSINI